MLFNSSFLGMKDKGLVGKFKPSLKAVGQLLKLLRRKCSRGLPGLLHKWEDAH